MTPCGRYNIFLCRKTIFYVLSHHDVTSVCYWIVIHTSVKTNLQLRPIAPEGFAEGPKSKIENILRQLHFCTAVC